MMRRTYNVMSHALETSVLTETHEPKRQITFNPREMNIDITAALLYPLITSRISRIDDTNILHITLYTLETVIISKGNEKSSFAISRNRSSEKRRGKAWG